MAWETVLDQEQLTVKLDSMDRTALIEVNDGGISPNYVTIRLQDQEIGELIAALEKIRQTLKEG
ncbi:hypothetical protein D3C73_474950 [compost metagenome]